jgi:hypothetical protein
MPVLRRCVESPEFRRRANEFDADFGLAHETLSKASDAGEDFFSCFRVANCEELIFRDMGSQQDECAVRIHDERIGFLPENFALLGLHANRDADSSAQAFAAPPRARIVLRRWLGSGHVNGVSILNFNQPRNFQPGCCDRACANANLYWGRERHLVGVLGGFVRLRDVFIAGSQPSASH